MVRPQSRSLSFALYLPHFHSFRKINVAYYIQGPRDGFVRMEKSELKMYIRDIWLNNPSLIKQESKLDEELKVVGSVWLWQARGLLDGGQEGSDGKVDQAHANSTTWIIHSRWIMTILTFGNYRTLDHLNVSFMYHGNQPMWLIVPAFAMCFSVTVVPPLLLLPTAIPLAAKRLIIWHRRKLPGPLSLLKAATYLNITF